MVVIPTKGSFHGPPFCIYSIFEVKILSLFYSTCCFVKDKCSKVEPKKSNIEIAIEVGVYLPTSMVNKNFP